MENWKETALRALAESIVHWEANVEKSRNGKLRDNDIRYTKCALCKMDAILGNNDCEICPITLHTDDTDCHKTVWYELRININTNKPTLRLCKQMLKMLKDIRVLVEKDKLVYEEE